MKIITTITLSMMAIILLTSGCGSDIEEGEASKTSTLDLSCAEDYFDASISSVLGSCVSCHSSEGVAKSTRLVFKEPLNNNKDENYKILKSFIDKTDTLIIDKGTNTVSHGGGEQLTGSSIIKIETFTDYLKGRKVCVADPDVGSIKASSISLMSPEQTLRSASFKLQGQAPSSSEVTKVSSIEAIDAVLDAYMESDVFYEWLYQNFNDMLLTDFYTPGRDGENLLSKTDFPNKAWYDNYRGDGDNQFNNDERYRMYRNVNYAIASEPVNLMVHVVKEGRPFSEILTADYILVNPYSAKTYGLDIDGFTFDLGDLNMTVDQFEAKYDKTELREVKLPGIPHAGVLTTITYLNRIPSTNTNLDRARSAKTQLYFFDTDILGLSNRPINSVDVIGNSATWTNPNCTVCHNVMEPISSTFSNWNNEGRYMPGWRIDLAPYSQEPGLSIDHKAPSSSANNLLQWMTKEMVKDDRFAMASVKMFVKAILGREALKKPETDALNYDEALQAYNYENEILQDIKSKFVADNMNAKVIIKEIIKSPLFRASGLDNSNEILSKNLGLAHLITPEELDRKIYDVMGYYWSYSRYPSNQDVNEEKNRHRLLREDNYKTLYGGINSKSITQRTTELNGIMANVQLRMAIQMGCFPTTRDFYFDLKDRKLFPYVTETQEPITDGSISDIKKNIQYLHEHILGEKLSINDSEIEATYKLFFDTYTEGKARVDNGEEARNLLYECSVYYNPETFERLSDEGDAQDEIYNDDTYVIRSWSAVITYLLSDFKFVYENSAE